MNLQCHVKDENQIAYDYSATFSRQPAEEAEEVVRSEKIWKKAAQL